MRQSPAREVCPKTTSGKAKAPLLTERGFLQLVFGVERYLSTIAPAL